jgi:hypothetical protein
MVNSQGGKPAIVLCGAFPDKAKKIAVKFAPAKAKGHLLHFLQAQNHQNNPPPPPISPQIAGIMS